jgi:hypothetical protein
MGVPLRAGCAPLPEGKPMAVVHALRENKVALAGELEKGRYWRMRLCWKCQKDKPMATGKVYGLKGVSASTVAGKLPFVCLDCLNEKAARASAAN